MQNVPKATARLSNHRPRVMPLLTGVSSTVYAQRKAAAAHNPHAPINTHPYSTPTVDGSTTPIATNEVPRDVRLVLDLSVLWWLSTS